MSLFHSVSLSVCWQVHLLAILDSLKWHFWHFSSLRLSTSVRGLQPAWPDWAIFEIPLQKNCYKSCPTIWETAWAFWKASRFSKKRLCLHVWQILDKLGYFMFHHLDTLSSSLPSFCFCLFFFPQWIRQRDLGEKRWNAVFRHEVEIFFWTHQDKKEKPKIHL